MQLTRLPDAEAVARHAAEGLIVAANEARSRAGVAHICLTGGTTPLQCYELLDSLLDDWSGIHLWYCDERCVGFDDPDSNHGQVHQRLRAPGATWHPMPGPQGPELGAAHYSEELDGTVLDFVHLGLGPDGHTASLFPDHPVLDAVGVAAGVTDSPKPPPERITLTLPKLNEARRIVLLATGEGKAEALARALGEPSRTTPASLVDRSRLEVVADEAACAELAD